MKHLFPLLFLLALLTPARAQDPLAVDWFSRSVGEGVTWRYYYFDDLYGEPQSISYIEADLSQPGIAVQFPFVEGGRALTSDLISAQVPGAVAGINGTYFDTGEGGGHVTYLRVDGQEFPLDRPRGKGEWGIGGGVTIGPDGAVDVTAIPAEGWTSDTVSHSIMANGPLLIEGGEIPSAQFKKIGPHCTSRHPRSAVGVTTSGTLILLTADGRTQDAAGLTCEQLAQLMRDLGCVDALNLDGGGSTTLWAAGEPHGGVVNYPSDNGRYDHRGERESANAIAVVAPPAAGPTPWDGRLVEFLAPEVMVSGESAPVTALYRNIGTETWRAGEVRLVTSRPTRSDSPFADPVAWLSPSEPARLYPAEVAPGGLGLFHFPVRAPEREEMAQLTETFELIRVGHGRFGPADNEARFQVLVGPEGGLEGPIVIESRPDGKHPFFYLENGGFANSSVDIAVPEATPGLGSRYGSTYNTLAGPKSAAFAPLLRDERRYHVYVAWPAAPNRRDRITYRVLHAGGEDVFTLDQSATADEWVRLGDGPYTFAPGRQGGVEVSNEEINESGSFYPGIVKFAPAE
ncbi:MAG: phosphodiester glycosidase family protein [Sumerlaeia bacterium]